MHKRSKSKGDKRKRFAKVGEGYQAAEKAGAMWEYGPFVAETTTVPHFVSESIQEIAAHWKSGIPAQIGPKELGYATACDVISDSRIVFTYENIPDRRYVGEDCKFGFGSHTGVCSTERADEKQDLKISFTIQKPIFELGHFICYKKINRRCIECLRELITFYSHSDNVLNLIVPIVNRTFDVSKRALEFCCVTKAKRDNVCYKYTIEGQPLLVDIHHQYNQWLKMWKRECFDFFQRYTRIYVPYTHQDRPKLVETTTGQLHGIYWAHTYGVIEYARKNLDTIMHDMSITHGRNRRDIKNHKAKGLRRPRQPLVDNSSKGLNMFPVDITVVFGEEDDNYEEYSSDNGFQEPCDDEIQYSCSSLQCCRSNSDYGAENEIDDTPKPMEIC
jgi:hypothetical protein